MQTTSSTQLYFNNVVRGLDRRGIVTAFHHLLGNASSMTRGMFS